MTDNELEAIRQNIACPQFGDDHYGAWGILRLDQRKTIYKMWDEITRQKAEIESWKRRFDEMAEENDWLNETLKTTQAEAVKEFAERVKEEAYRTEFGTPVVDVEDIDIIANKWG